MVRARLSSKPLFSVSEREPPRNHHRPARAPEKFALASPKPLFSVSERTTAPEIITGRPRFQKKSSRSPPPKPFCFPFPGANHCPGNQERPARALEKFALASPLTLCFPFPGANHRPGNHHRPARAPEKFALAAPLTLCFPFPSANHRPRKSSPAGPRSEKFALAAPESRIKNHSSVIDFR